MKEFLNISNDECPNCESLNVETNYKNQQFKYGVGNKAVDLEAEVPVLTCKHCGFEYTDYRAEDAQHDAVCRYLGILSPREILGIRKNYSFTRSNFAEISGFGEASLARWESGELIQNTANDNYLYLLGHPDNLIRLQVRKRAQSGKKSESIKFRGLRDQTIIKEKRREAACFSL